jgi:hypothetical protein
VTATVIDGDERAITNLVHGLALAIDDADGDRIEALMRDATFRLDDYPEVVGGAAYRELIERGMLLHDGSPGTQHVISYLTVHVAADRSSATSTCYVSVLQAVADLPLQVVLSGRYADSFVRDAGAWRFERRDMQVVLRGDTSRHSRHRM